MHHVKVRLTKFKALPGDALAQVELGARADEVVFRREQKPWGTVDIVDECRRLGLYRLNVNPGAEIPNHLHRVMTESELVLHPGLAGWIDGSPTRPLEVGERFRWKHDLPHGYRNVGDRCAGLLCIDSPPFDPTDEQHREAVIDWFRERTTVIEVERGSGSSDEFPTSYVIGGF